jgi:hypothetical protein
MIFDGGYSLGDDFRNAIYFSFSQPDVILNPFSTASPPPHVYSIDKEN